MTDSFVIAAFDIHYLFFFAIVDNCTQISVIGQTAFGISSITIFLQVRRKLYTAAVEKPKSISKSLILIRCYRLPPVMQRRIKLLQHPSHLSSQLYTVYKVPPPAISFLG